MFIFIFYFSLIFAFPYPQNPHPVPAKYKSRNYSRKLKLCFIYFTFSFHVSFLLFIDTLVLTAMTKLRRNLEVRDVGAWPDRDKSKASDSFETMEQSSPHFTFHHMFNCRTFHFERGFHLIRQFFLFCYLSFKLRIVFDTFSSRYPITVAGSSAKSTAWRGSFHV